MLCSFIVKAQTMSESIITIKDVSVTLGKKFQALHDINLSFTENKIIGFIGPSGAGKTTLIRSIVGRQRISSGALTIYGLPAGSAKLRRSVSYMTQEPSIYNDLSVRENIRYFATMIGLPRKVITSEISRLFNLLNLSSNSTQLVSSLSGGQKQRVSLAIALIGQPKLLVLDEPTVGLDPLIRRELWNLFHKLAASGTSIIISSHVMDEAERCDELVLIRDGRVLATGSPNELCEKTHTKSVEQSFIKLVGESAS